jgi:hypothetical protein
VSLEVEIIPKSKMVALAAMKRSAMEGSAMEGSATEGSAG